MTVVQFSDLGISPSLRERLGSKGIRQPFEIQALAIPEIMNKKNVLALAQTGQGKTLACVLPILQELAADGGKHVGAVVMAPTATLANQIRAEFVFYGAELGVSTTLIVESMSFETIERNVANQPRIVVGTPGPILEAVKSGVLDLSRVDFQVIDEVDTLLAEEPPVVNLGDDPFGDAADLDESLAALVDREAEVEVLRSSSMADQIRELQNYLPPVHERRAILTTATVRRDLEVRVAEFLPGGLVVNATHSRPLETLQHIAYNIDGKFGDGLAAHLLRGPFKGKWLVLSEDPHYNPRRLEAISSALRKNRIDSGIIHEGLPVDKRFQRLDAINTGKLRVLVAFGADVRGLDFRELDGVINLDVPPSLNRYVQNGGRTGRAGRAGQVVTFYSSTEEYDMRALYEGLGVKAEFREPPADYYFPRSFRQPERNPERLVERLQELCGIEIARPGLFLTAVGRNRFPLDPRTKPANLAFVGFELLRAILAERIGSQIPCPPWSDLAPSLRQLGEFETIEQASNQFGLVAALGHSTQGQRPDSARQAHIFANLLAAVWIEQQSWEVPERIVLKAYEHLDGVSPLTRQSERRHPGQPRPLNDDQRDSFQKALDYEFRDARWLELAVNGFGVRDGRFYVPQQFFGAGRYVMRFLLADALRLAYGHETPEFLKARHKPMLAATNWYESPVGAVLLRTAEDLLSWKPNGNRDSLIMIETFLASLFFDGGIAKARRFLMSGLPEIVEAIRIAELDPHADFDPKRMQARMDVEGLALTRRLANRKSSGNGSHGAASSNGAASSTGAAAMLYARAEKLGAASKLAISAAKGGGIFSAVVRFRKEEIGRGRDKNREKAIEQAARQALEKLGDGAAAGAERT